MNESRMSHLGLTCRCFTPFPSSLYCGLPYFKPFLSVESDLLCTLKLHLRIVPSFLGKLSLKQFKGSPDQSRFIIEVCVGDSRIRPGTNLNLNIFISNRFWVDLEIQFQSRSMSDPALSDIDFESKMAWVWTTLKDSSIIFGQTILNQIY